MSERENGIGARLLAARARADLSLMQAAEALHVDPEVIHALDTENFTALGAGVYVRGHLRHYAELVKESVPELLACMRRVRMRGRRRISPGCRIGSRRTPGVRRCS